MTIKKAAEWPVVLWFYDGPFGLGIVALRQWPWKCVKKWLKVVVKSRRCLSAMVFEIKQLRREGLDYQNHFSNFFHSLDFFLFFVSRLRLRLRLRLGGMKKMKNRMRRSAIRNLLFQKDKIYPLRCEMTTLWVRRCCIAIMALKKCVKNGWR